MTLMEYLEDYASDETKKVGYPLIEKEIENVSSDKVKAIAKDNLEANKNGKRDFRF